MPTASIQNVPVTLTVTNGSGNSGNVTVSPTTLAFTTAQGSSPGAQTVSVTSASGATGVAFTVQVTSGSHVAFHQRRRQCHHSVLVHGQRQFHLDGGRHLQRQHSRDSQRGEHRGYSGESDDYRAGIGFRQPHFADLQLPRR